MENNHTFRNIGVIIAVTLGGCSSDKRSPFANVQSATLEENVDSVLESKTSSAQEVAAIHNPEDFQATYATTEGSLEMSDIEEVTVESFHLSEFAPKVNYRDAASLDKIFARVFQHQQSDFFDSEDQKNMGNLNFSNDDGSIYNSQPVANLSINYLQTLRKVSAFHCRKMLENNSGGTRWHEKLLAEKLFLGEDQVPTVEALRNFMIKLLGHDPEIDDFLQKNIDAWNASLEALKEESYYASNVNNYTHKRRHQNNVFVCMTLLTHPAVFTY